jgi:hypothetical protein
MDRCGVHGAVWFLALCEQTLHGTTKTEEEEQQEEEKERKGENESPNAQPWAQTLELWLIFGW